MRLNITIDFKALDNRSAKGAFLMARLFHFRFYIFEQIIIEEVNDRDSQAVAQHLQRGNGGAVISSADHIVHGGLRDAADRAQLVNSQVSLCT